MAKIFPSGPKSFLFRDLGSNILIGMASERYAGWIGQFDFSQKGWVSGKGRTAKWRDIEWHGKSVEPQFLMSCSDFLKGTDEKRDFKVTLMDVTSSTNTRTVIATAIHGVPCGHKTPTLTPNPWSNGRVLASAGILSSLLFDYSIGGQATVIRYFLFHKLDEAS